VVVVFSFFCFLHAKEEVIFLDEVFDRKV